MRPKKTKETTYTDKGSKREQVHNKYSKGDNSTTYSSIGARSAMKTTEKKGKALGASTYKKKTKMISANKAERQMGRKDKRY